MRKKNFLYRDELYLDEKIYESDRQLVAEVPAIRFEIMLSSNFSEENWQANLAENGESFRDNRRIAR